MPILKSVLRQFLFWILLFAINRVLYLLFLSRFLTADNITFGESLLSFWYGLRLDIATVSYILVFPLLVYLVCSIAKSTRLQLLIAFYHVLLILAFVSLSAAEIGIYEEWKTKMHFKALLYLLNPSEVYNTAETGLFFSLLAYIIIYAGICIFLFYKKVYRRFEIKRTTGNFILIPLIALLLFVGIRGGIQEVAINQSESYYSKHQILNLAAVNSVFNIAMSTFENQKAGNTNPFVFFEQNEAEEIVNKLYKTESDTTIEVLNTKQPNIVLIILESWCADLIKPLGGELEITPQFNALVDEGLLFSKIYAPGTRSEQGLASIYSGYPAHPFTSITIQPSKYSSLPSLNKVLSQMNYSSSFYFGGQLIYGNIKSYIYFNEIDKIYEQKDFPDDAPSGKLGIHDEYIFDRQFNDLSGLEQPFFSSIFTLSTHSPFDMPLKRKPFTGEEMSEYFNSAWYTDSVLGDYFRKAKRQEWYDNTLFILVADHSHYFRPLQPYYQRDYHHIPMLFLGGALKEEYKGTSWDKLGSQADIATTVLKQLDLPTERFIWSKNLLNPYSQDFAYVAFEVGIGWIRPEGSYFYDPTIDFFYDDYYRPPKHLWEKQFAEGRAFLQVVFDDYLSR